MSTHHPDLPPADAAPPDARARLQTHFSAAPPAAHPSRWDALWAGGTFLPWDRGAPNPALADALRAQRGLLGPPAAAPGGRRPRALVPGCGRGYDVLLLAGFGFDAWGLEASAHAVRAAEALGEERRGVYEEAGRAAEGAGRARFVHGDFFEQGWEEAVGGGGFDLIYDYTFLCALPPALRPAWAARMAALLGPAGRLVCLEFPTYKEPSAGGPPWALPPPVYEQLLCRPGDEVAYGADGHVVDDRERLGRPSETALERIAHWMPERTHEIGKGTDWVSVWRHRG